MASSVVSGAPTADLPDKGEMRANWAFIKTELEHGGFVIDPTTAAEATADVALANLRQAIRFPQGPVRLLALEASASPTPAEADAAAAKIDEILIHVGLTDLITVDHPAVVNAILQPAASALVITTYAPSLVHTGTFNFARSIAASEDDARETVSTGSVSITATVATLGSTDRQALRFVNVTVPPGGTVTNATVQLTATQTGSGDHTTTISGQAADNAATFTTSSGSITSRGQTTATVAWVIPDWTLDARTAAQLSPNLASIIQEIVNRPGWASGNAIVLFLQRTGGTSNRQYATWDDTTLQEAELVIEYQT